MPDGRLISGNPALANILGYPTHEDFMINIDNIKFVNLVDSKNWEALTGILRQDGLVKGFECEIHRLDGSTTLVSINARADQKADGNTLMFEGTVSDITERRALEKRLVRAEKMESIGFLAAGVAHEINTPIYYIQSNIELLADIFKQLEQLVNVIQKISQTIKSGGPGEHYIRQLEKEINESAFNYLAEQIPEIITSSLDGVERIAKIVESMRYFAHPGIKEKTAIDVNKAIQNAITVSRNEWKYSADVVTDLDNSLPRFHGYQGEFHQALLNVIVNAAQAIADVIRESPDQKGKITITTKL